LILYHIISYLVFLCNIILHSMSGPLVIRLKTVKDGIPKNRTVSLYNNVVHVPVEVVVSRRDFFFSISFYFCDHLTPRSAHLRKHFIRFVQCARVYKWVGTGSRSPVRFWNGFEITSSICSRHHSWLSRHKRYWIQIYKISTLSSQINNYLPGFFYSSKLVTLTVMQILGLPSSRLFQIIFFINNCRC